MKMFTFLNAFCLNWHKANHQLPTHYYQFIFTYFEHPLCLFLFAREKPWKESNWEWGAGQAGSSGVFALYPLCLKQALSRYECLINI